jgi:hypothetical protein
MTIEDLEQPVIADYQQFLRTKCPASRMLAARQPWMAPSARQSTKSAGTVRTLSFAWSSTVAGSRDRTMRHRNAAAQPAAVDGGRGRAAGMNLPCFTGPWRPRRFGSLLVATPTHVTISQVGSVLAAWQTAQITRAVSFVDIERVPRRNQERLTDIDRGLPG